MTIAVVKGRDEETGGLSSARWQRQLRILNRISGVIVVLLALEFIPRLGIVSEEYLPPVSQSLTRLMQELTTGGQVWSDLAATMQGWALGLVLSLAVAIPMAIAIGSLWVVFYASRVVVEFLRPIPSVALIPLAVLVFGSGLETKVFLVFNACLWPLLIQLINGIRDIDPLSLETAQSFGLNARQRILHVILPGLLPFFVVGVRVATSLALVVAVTAEIVVGAPGLGRRITDAMQSGNVELMYAMVFLVGAVGVSLNLVVRRAEARVLFWHPSQRLRVTP